MTNRTKASVNAALTRALRLEFHALDDYGRIGGETQSHALDSVSLTTDTFTTVGAFFVRGQPTACEVLAAAVTTNGEVQLVDADESTVIAGPATIIADFGLTLPTSIPSVAATRDRWVAVQIRNTNAANVVRAAGVRYSRIAPTVSDTLAFGTGAALRRFFLPYRCYQVAIDAVELSGSAELQVRLQNLDTLEEFNLNSLTVTNAASVTSFENGIPSGRYQLLARTSVVGSWALNAVHFRTPEEET
jgi:hypothetical protein